MSQTSPVKHLDRHQSDEAKLADVSEHVIWGELCIWCKKLQKYESTLESDETTLCEHILYAVQFET